jgi:asparagine synthase (glutamine-hydrolysing)
MCGINGVLTFNSKIKIEEKIIIEMRDTMVHRGPDGGGVWISNDNSIGLGHRRLSIIDVSEIANQPMSNEDDTIKIVFNGEIYNHADIRKELEAKKKYKWKTDHSDTEVIIHAYEEWGIECIHKFRGMFAIALWDSRLKELWLIRDRLGIKPLYYSIDEDRITFASEIKALLKFPNQKREVNEDAFYHYLSFLTTPAPNTLFNGIYKLQPGTWLNITNAGQKVEKKYWDVWDYTTPLINESDDKIASLILKELKESVRLRKESDVPVGVFLSGGIDSSTNAALFAEGETKPVETFTIGYKGEYDTYKNETDYAELMANQVGANHHELLLTIDDLIDFLPEMVHLQDEPIADPVCVPVYYVSKLARDNNVIVCQVGEGADELFWGYEGWKVLLNFQNFTDRLPNFIKKLGLKILKLQGKDQSFRYEYLRRVANSEPVFWGGAEAFTEQNKKKLLSKRLREKYKNTSSWEVLKPIREKFEEKAWEKSNLNWMSYLDLNLRLPELLLMRVDKMAMGVSLEGRVPFLDYKFVELALSIPEKVKTRNGISKYILKKAVRGLIPDVLIDRKKQGFGVPVYEWFFDKLGTNIKKDLNAFCEKTDFFDKEAIDELIKSGNGPQIWYIYNFVLWWNKFIENK